LSKIKNKIINEFSKGLLLIFVTWVPLFFLVFKKLFSVTEEGVSSISCIWGDWTVHFIYSNPFTYRTFDQWFVSNPVFINGEFNYPFLLDAFSGLLVRIGFDRIFIFSFISFLVCVLMIVVVYGAAFIFLKSKEKAFVVLALFLASGGLGFLNFFLNFSKLTLIENLGNLNNNILFSNFIPIEILPQRSLPLGIAIVLIIIINWEKWRVFNFQKISKLNFTLTFFLCIILPLVHMHSFFVLFIAGLFFFLIDFRNKFKWLFFAFVVSVPVFFIWFVFYYKEIGGNFFIWNPGWVSDDISFFGFLKFWIVNWGCIFPLLFLSFFKANFSEKFFAIMGFCIFLIANLIIFQPWSFDNLKLFTFAYLFICFPIGSFLVNLWNKKEFYKKVFALFLFILLTFSGFLEISNLLISLNKKEIVWTREELSLSEEFKKISKPGDVVLTFDKHNNFISNLTGARILMGYRGWLWSYGIDYSKIESEIKSVYEGASNSFEIIRKYGIEYILVGEYEKKYFEVNELFLKNNFELILKTDNYEIFRINKQK